MSRTVVAGIWLVVLAAAVGLGVAAAREPTLPGDLRIMREIQGWRFPGEALSDVVRAVTTTQVVVACGAAACVWLWVAGARREAVALAIGLAVLPLLQSGLKDIVDRPRPTPDVVDIRAGFGSESFPAGHVMSPTVLYGFLLATLPRLPLPPALRAAVAIWSACVLATTGVVNVWLGVHWPSDVLGGYLCGLVLVLPIVLAVGYDQARPTSS